MKRLWLILFLSIAYTQEIDNQIDSLQREIESIDSTISSWESKLIEPNKELTKLSGAEKNTNVKLKSIKDEIYRLTLKRTETKDEDEKDSLANRRSELLKQSEELQLDKSLLVSGAESIASSIIKVEKLLIFYQAEKNRKLNEIDRLNLVKEKGTIGMSYWYKNAKHQKFFSTSDSLWIADYILDKPDDWTQHRTNKIPKLEKDEISFRCYGTHGRVLLSLYIDELGYVGYCHIKSATNVNIIKSAIYQATNNLKYHPISKGGKNVRFRTTKTIACDMYSD